MTKFILLSVLMMLVTVPSRVLPIFFLGDRTLPPFLEAFLGYIPYAALGALIFPDVLSATGDITSSAAGAVTAFALGWLGNGPLTVLCGGILAAYLFGLI